MLNKHPLSKHAAAGNAPGREILLEAAEALELPSVASIWHDLVSHLGRTLEVDWAFAANLLPGPETKLRTLAAWHRGNWVDDFDFQLVIPFDDPLLPTICMYDRNACKNLRNDWLKRVKAQSFAQIKLVGSFGQARGLLAIAHAHALERADQVESILRIYAFKATVELERKLEDERFYCQLLDSLGRSPHR